MRHVKEETSSRAGQAIDLISAVKELHRHSPQELSKLLRDSENFILRHLSEKGSTFKIDVEKLARFLPLHLIAVLISSKSDEALLRYLLCGIQLLHSLCDLGSRHSKLEQILLEDLKVSEQLIDLVFYLLIVLGGYRKGNHVSSPIPFIHSALVACSLYLLPQCLSPQWHELVQVLVAHPKVDIFMDVAFRAVHIDIKFLQSYLSDQCNDISIKPSSTAEQRVNYLSQQCEASLQFLLSLSQQKLFRERLLRNKELCGKGGILILARAILKLNISVSFSEYSTVVAAVSRLKSKVLSMLLHLCEAESVSYLDEVASCPRSLTLAKSVASEVLNLLKNAFSRDPRLLNACSERIYPVGLLQLNALRLADILSDDSNFRSHIAIRFPEVLTTVVSFPHGEFLSTWCSSDPPSKEEDASLEFDSFAAAGWILDSFSSLGLLNETYSESNFIPNNMPQASYAHQRTSLLVKVIANLHFFGPQICKDYEKNLFLHKFLECLFNNQPKSSPSDTQKAATVCRNLRSLLGHAESLIPSFLNEDDVQLFRVFLNQLEPLNTLDEFEANRHQVILASYFFDVFSSFLSFVVIVILLLCEHVANYLIVSTQHYPTVPLEQMKAGKFEGSLSCDKFSKLNISERHEEAQSTGGCSSSHLPRKMAPSINARSNLKEGMSENIAFQEEKHYHDGSGNKENVKIKQRTKVTDMPVRVSSGGLTETDVDACQNVETSGSDSSTTRGKNFTDQMGNGEFPHSNDHQIESGSGGAQENEKVETVQCEERQPRKRKRTIMNDEQIAAVERALIEEPDMQRKPASIQSWADKLCLYGSEVTPSQLKNWLNNRKARLARAAAKDVRAVPEGDNAFPDKKGRSGMAFYDSPESPVEGVSFPSSSVRGTKGTWKTGMGDNFEVAPAEAEPANKAPVENISWEPGQNVVLLGPQGEEIGKGKVHQAQGIWFGRSLGRSGKCVVNVSDLNVDRSSRLLYPSEATGNSFDETDSKLGVMCVLWDSHRLLLMQTQ